MMHRNLEHFNLRFRFIAKGEVDLIAPENIKVVIDYTGLQDFWGLAVGSDYRGFQMC